MYSQTTTITIGSDILCPGDEVMVPVNVTDFFDIGAFTLFVGYDTAVLTFAGHLNEHPETPGIFSNAMTEPTSQIGLSWSSLNPANITSGKLVDLQFQYTSENCDLTFNPGCELVNSSLIIIEYTSTNGSVIQSDPLISQNPLDILADDGSDVLFVIDASNVSLYQWQMSVDQGQSWIDVINNQQFLGVDTDSLFVLSVSYQMNNTYFRCKVCHDECCVFSQPALLNVNPATAFQQEMLSDNNLFYVRPNPVTSESEIYTLLNSNGEFRIKIFDIWGNCVAELNERKQAGEYRFLLSDFVLKPGIYFCSGEFFNNRNTKICIEKIIVNRD